MHVSRTLPVMALCLAMPAMIFSCNNGNGGEDIDADAAADLPAETIDQDTVADPEPDEVVPDPDPGPEEIVEAVDMAEEDEIEEVVDVGEEEEEIFDDSQVRAYCEIVVGDFCEYFSDCCTADESAFYFDDLMRDAHCEDRWHIDMAIDDCVEDYVESIIDGTVTINADQLVECETAVSEVRESCLNLTVFLWFFSMAVQSGCSGVWQGTLVEGSECNSERDWECMDGYCDYLGSGQCKPYEEEGGDCIHNYACLPGQACTENTCSPWAGIGAPCDNTLGDCLDGWCDEVECAEFQLPGNVCELPEATGSCEGICDNSLAPPLCINFCDGEE